MIDEKSLFVMRVLFVNPAMERYTRQVAMPLGLLSIATYLQANGHTVKILDHTIRFTDFGKELASFRPDAVGVSVLSMKSFTDAERVSLSAKRFGAVVIWGGMFASLDPEFVFKNIDIDCISVSEGEATWLDVVETMASGGDLHTVPGLCYAENGKVIHTPARPFIDLSLLPPLDFTLIDVEPYLGTMYGCKKTALLYMAKGCIGNCSFCFNKTFHRQCYRMRPVETFLQEVKYLIEHHGVDCIYFADELWCRNRGEMRYQCDAFRRSGLDFKWGVQTRVGIFEREDFQYMKDSGCLWIDFGIETGSREMMKRIHKGIPYDKIAQTFRDCAEVGIITLANFIIGFPDETEEQLRETVQMANTIEATQKTFFFYMPGPGSPLYEELVRAGRYHPPKDFKAYTKVKFFYSPKPNFSKVPTRELKAIRAYFLWKGFSRKFFSEDARTYDIAKKDVLDVLKQFRGHGFRFAWQLFWISAYEFTDIFLYAHLFPHILRKYGL